MRAHRGPFRPEEAAHLLRRAAFAPAPGEAEEFAALGLDEAVSRLTSPRDPVSLAEADHLERTLSDSDDGDTLAGCWLLRMALSPNPLRERMVLFFHNHFTSSLRKVGSGRLMLGQLALFRRHGLGSFHRLAREVSRDPAMIIYLDLQRSTRDAPNENFARELMELFTMGVGHYTEQDIQEAARAFTGYRLREERFHFSRAAHDDGWKRILGRKDRFDGDAVVALCTHHPATARFMARKLARAFVADDPGEDVVSAIAASWKAHDGVVADVLADLFRSALFHDPRHRHARTRGPAELATATLRGLGMRLPFSRVAAHVRLMGQALLDPPTVKGWEGGRSWLNPASWLARRSFLIWAGLQANERNVALLKDGPREEEPLLRHLFRHLLGRTPAPDQASALLAILDRRGGIERSEILSSVLIHPSFQKS